MVEVGKITLKEAGEKIGVSYRQASTLREKKRIDREFLVYELMHAGENEWGGKPPRRNCLCECWRGLSSRLCLSPWLRIPSCPWTHQYADASLCDAIQHPGVPP